MVHAPNHSTMSQKQCHTMVHVQLVLCYGNTMVHVQKPQQYHGKFPKTQYHVKKHYNTMVHI